MNIETYFEEQKGITIDAAFLAGARYTAIDICRFAKNYHESEVKNMGIQRVSGRHFCLDPDDLEFVRALQEENRLQAVKWLCEKIRPYTLTPLKDAKAILDAYR